MTSPASMYEQLHVPDRTGRDLALLRTRAYRFSNDLRWYVLAEALEEHYLAGKPPKPSTMDIVRVCLTSLREHGVLPTVPSAVAEAENVDIEASLGQRAPCSWHHFTCGIQPTLIIVIVGAPRSGTSHLFNLLAATGRFAYFTTTSCWAWPVRNLRRPERYLFTTLGQTAVLAVDNKKTRIIPGLIMPGEAEDIWHRAMPVYRHVHGHTYDISDQRRSGNSGILDAAASSHLAHFDRDVLLVKSPFNSFRIPQLEQHWGTKTRYIHIVRDQHETADSMRRNHFEFASENGPLSAEDAWTRFTGAVEASAPAGRTVTIRHADLLHDSPAVLRDLDRQLP